MSRSTADRTSPSGAPARPASVLAVALVSALALSGCTLGLDFEVADASGDLPSDSTDTDVDASPDSDVSNECAELCSRDPIPEGLSCSDDSVSCKQCDPDTADCNGDFDDGCETNLTSDREHCGSCDNSCTGLSKNWTGACSAGRCTYTCSAPAYSLDDPDDACEIEVGELAESPESDETVAIARPTPGATVASRFRTDAPMLVEAIPDEFGDTIVLMSTPGLDPPAADGSGDGLRVAVSSGGELASELMASVATSGSTWFATTLPSGDGYDFLDIDPDRMTDAGANTMIPTDSDIAPRIDNVAPVVAEIAELSPSHLRWFRISDLDDDPLVVDLDVVEHSVVDLAITPSAVRIIEPGPHVVVAGLEGMLPVLSHFAFEQGGLSPIVMVGGTSALPAAPIDVEPFTFQNDRPGVAVLGSEGDVSLFALDGNPTVGIDRTVEKKIGPDEWGISGSNQPMDLEPLPGGRFVLVAQETLVFFSGEQGEPEVVEHQPTFMGALLPGQYTRAAFNHDDSVLSLINGGKVYTLPLTLTP